jgi:hypothetical protein
LQFSCNCNLFSNLSFGQLSRKANLRASKREDDAFLLQHCGVFPLLALALRDNSYREWMWRADMRPFYAELQTFCGMMLFRKYGANPAPRFVLLKSPFHLSFFRAFDHTVSSSIPPNVFRI